MDPMSEELKALDGKLADENFYNGDPEAVAATLKRRGELASELEELEMRWLEISEELAAIE
jgi:ATP-binding cassette subfamily F protein 3